MKSRFIGKWVLQADQSEYDSGTPPKSASYEFEDAGDGALAVLLEWTDAGDNSFKVQYMIQPDGLKKRNENTAVDQEVMAEYENEFTLNTSLYTNNNLVHFATRIIDDEGTMKVIQIIYQPDGQEVKKVQYFKK